EPVNHFDRFDLLLLPAFFRAIATACFCGLPAFISVLMFELIVFREEPFLRGIETFSCSARTEREPSALGSVGRYRFAALTAILRSEKLIAASLRRGADLKSFPEGIS